MQGFLLSVVAFFSGPLYDKGHVRYLFYVGSAFNVIGLLGTSFATSYATIFLAFGVALGLGCGILYIPAIALISAHFDKEQAALPTALAMSGSSIGGIVYPILLRQIIPKIGFFWACRVFAAINGGLLLVACLLVRPKEKLVVEVTSDEPPAPTTLRSLLDWKLFLFGGCAMLMNFGIDVPFYFIPTFVREQLKQPPETEASLLAGLNASSLVGRLFLNWLSEYSRPLIIFQFTILISGALLFWWFTISNLAGIIMFVICYGFVDGGLISLIAPCLQELFPEPSTFGARLGIVESLQGVGFLVGPPIAGAILDSPAGYFGVSLFNGTLFFVIFLLIGVFFTRKLFLKKISSKDEPEGIWLRPIPPRQGAPRDAEAQAGEGAGEVLRRRSV